MPILLLLSMLVAGVFLLVLVLALAFRRSTGDHSPEYSRHLVSPEWRITARATLEVTKRRCCLLPWRRAVHAHHLHYRNMRREQTLRDVVPVSDLGHRIIHAWIFWRGPGRLPMNLWLRTMTVVLAVWVRPVVRWLALVLLLGVAGVVWHQWTIIVQQAQKVAEFHP